MSERPEKVTIRDVYEVVGRLEQKVEENFPTKTEMRLTVALALLGGSAVASVVTAFLTRLSPIDQAHTAVKLIVQFL